MPTKNALCIGINDYPGTANDLSGCVNDANDWAEVLTAKGFSVKLLLDAKATRNNIVREIKALMKKTDAGDSVVIQYSGHGSFVPDENGDEPDGNDECICPHDIFVQGKANFITDDELFDLYSLRHKESKLLIISDSCHSGTVSKAGPALGGDGPVRKMRFLAPAAFLSEAELEKLGTADNREVRSASPPGRYAGLLMGGCRDKQVSYDASFGGKANGAFSFVALEALKKLKASATYADWHKAIKQRLPSVDYPQTPTLFGSRSMKSWKVFS